jgi:hypothetical protein
VFCCPYVHVDPNGPAEPVKVVTLDMPLVKKTISFFIRRAYVTKFFLVAYVTNKPPKINKLVHPLQFRGREKLPAAIVKEPINGDTLSKSHIFCWHHSLVSSCRTA